mmetsp:Transcript_16036/g.27649  ORF Transcript_16036/g.27649 Transcript_16036/m.27649 type:complete len:219 (+) Transcript_16036:402-1058(+)
MGRGLRGSLAFGHIAPGLRLRKLRCTVWTFPVGKVSGKVHWRRYGTQSTRRATVQQDVTGARLNEALAAGGDVMNNFCLYDKGHTLGGFNPIPEIPLVLCLVNERVVQKIQGRRPLRGILLQALEDKLHELGGHLIGWKLWAGLVNGVHHVPEALRLRIGELPEEALGHAEAETPDVRRVRVRLPAQSLRGHVSDGAGESGGLGGGIGKLGAGDAKVS